MGLLSSPNQQVGGLLGAAPNLDWKDYGLALLVGGVKGAAGLALDNREQKRRMAQLGPIADQLMAAFQPQATFSQTPDQAPQGMMQAPVASEQGGMLSRPLQAGPGFQGTPTMGSKPATPDLAQLAPLLLQAQASGMNTSPITGLLGSMADERQANKPTIFNTAKGLLSVPHDGGTPEVLWEAPVNNREGLSPGYEWADDAHTMQRPIKGGPYDLGTIENQATTRRKVLLHNPTPSRARAAASGGDSTVLPPGYRAK